MFFVTVSLLNETTVLLKYRFTFNINIHSYLVLNNKAHFRDFGFRTELYLKLVLKQPFEMHIFIIATTQQAIL